MPQQQRDNKSNQALPPGFVPLDSPDTGASAKGVSSDLPPGFEPLPTQQQGPDLSRRPSWWDYAKGVGKLAWEDTGLGGIQKVAGAVSDWGSGKAAANRQENLVAAAQGKQAPHSELSNQLLSDVGKYGEYEKSAASPEAAAIGVGTVLAPEVMGPALIGDALYKGSQSLPEALKGNPDALEQTLGAGSELAGGAAMAKSGPGAIRQRLAESAPTRAGKLYQRTITPGGVKAQTQLENVSEFQRGAPYLAEQERATPVQRKPATGALSGQDMGVMNLRQNAQLAAHQLWNNEIVPRTSAYDKVPVNHSQVVQDVLGTIDPSSPADAGRAASVQKLSDFYNRPTTVGQAVDMIKALNEDKAVQAYERATPDKQAELLGANLDLQARVKAADSLRRVTFDAIEQYGTPEEADYIRNARADWGALKGITEKLGNTQVPVPRSLLTRLGNTVRLSMSGGGAAREYMSRPLDTVFGLENPNRLAVRTSRILGKSNLTPRQGPAMPTSPWAPPQPAYPQPIGPQATPAQLATGGQPAPQSLVGGPPTMGFPAQLPSMWDPKGPVNPTWETPGTSVTSDAGELGVQPTSVELPDTLLSTGRGDLPPGLQGLSDAQINRIPSSLRQQTGRPTPAPGSYSPGGRAEVRPPSGGPAHPPSDQGGASIPTSMTPPPTDLSVTPRETPDATVLPEQIQPDFTDQSVHPWQSEARVQNKQGDIRNGEPPVIVARQNPDGTVSPVKGHQTPVAAAREGSPVQIVNAGPMTDAQKAATTAESHFFPKDDRPVRADMGKDADNERDALPEEVKSDNALPPREGPQSPVVQRGNNLPEQLPVLRPEVQEMAGTRRQGPEWTAQQIDTELRRVQSILRNPRATPEERQIAAAQLQNYKELAQKYRGIF